MTPAPRAAFGLTAEELAPPPVDVWPCVWPIVQAFQRLLTQWNVGPNGPVGLRYEAVDGVFRRLGIEDDLAAFDDLRVMEAAALSVMADQRKRKR